MANYYIIGGDEKVYGPITEAEVHQWISEGRLAADSRARAEQDADFRPLGQFREFAAALGSQVSDPAFTPAAAATHFSDHDYELDIGGCISRGYELFKENFGLLFATCLIMMAVQFGFMFAIGAMMAPLNNVLAHLPVFAQVGLKFLLPVITSLVVGPMAGGVNYLFLKKIRGQETSVGDVFAGFQKAFAQLYLGALVVGLITGACLLPFQYIWQTKTGPLMEQLQHLKSDPSAMQNLLPQFMLAFTNSLPVLVVCVVPVTFFAVTWMFTLPLIIDKGMTFSAAMKASWSRVTKHWWHVFGLFVVAALVSGIGALACCIGVLFTVPIGIAATMFAYETLFGAEKN